MQLSKFLATYFYTTEELCHTLSIDEETLSAWQQSSLFPKPSYCLQSQLECSSYSGIYQCEEYQDYYPRGAASWGQLIIKHDITSSCQAFNYFAQQYSNQLSKLAEQGFAINEELFGSEIDEHLQQVWQQFLCSKYGVLTQNGLVEEAVQLDVAKLLIDDITEMRTKTGLNMDERQSLHKALKLINRALSHGTGNEGKNTLRHRYIDDVVAKYDLSVK
ncbi:DUF6058 family natural product biosynthesis protein [Pseudoalteromonas sp. ACER1]|jgi:hypothetical protein|uniref:DUF6058 family natural product biosynthesis protein n=1 Tax=unclassified Pseudoalteromonas TaxID=194690 RepID=UPI000C500EB1|nr:MULTISPECIES: DUF6058 family natural product biosynthesis protein [unclassified Pseudoalteromonas]MAH27311.1 hypothetical protein [Pseudoalteromonadaceae bacterium]MBC7008335.1 hypothetical protein [Pseudoalteromonas sp. BZK2]MCF2847303.1 DUF6058 family natural product biosynthesis protein [Pseudoalteromonas sp. PAST1]MCH2086053.1 DUF6058 family natural product biosynthesis protein [Pseudoalteromonas sp.]MCO7210451.1 DUF6058 family natural product biosynthesis protein [Pseudoalteromonas sp.|tara:strand:- start:175 stop:828 length:654 start_codon:yes stop_codon:yes gene_type:complete